MRNIGSNEIDTIRLIEELLVPYIEKVKEEKTLPQSQNSLLVWDAFKAQSTPKVMDTLSSYGIKAVMVPKNMTHLLQQQTHSSKNIRNGCSVNISCFYYGSSNK